MTKDQVLQLKENLKAELIETHISWVLLSGDKAYKIKKPVTFSFLDFSSLTTRKEMCEKELELNGRLSDIYLKTQVIHEYNDHISFDGNGIIIDYAVEMKRMPNEQRMDVLLKEKQVLEKDVLSLARQIASFHKRASVVKDEDDVAFVDQRFKNLLATRDYLGRVYGDDALEIVDNAMNFHKDFMIESSEIFNQRVGQGFKRNLHGDLHAQNIYLLDKPVVFDCIEFDSRYRHIDVLSEVAFLCMDMEAYGKKDLSALFLEEYLHEHPCMENDAEKALFHYYLTYRANVRLKVNALREMQEEKEVTTEMTNRYLMLLKKYLNKF